MKAVSIKCTGKTLSGEEVKTAFIVNKFPDAESPNPEAEIAEVIREWGAEYVLRFLVSAATIDVQRVFRAEFPNGVGGAMAAVANYAPSPRNRSVVSVASLRKALASGAISRDALLALLQVGAEATEAPDTDSDSDSGTL